MNLFELAQNNDLQALKEHITDINIVDIKRRTLLHWAVIGDAVDVLVWLIKKNININAVNESGETALFESVRRSNFELTKLLISNNANPNIANRRYELPIHIAAHRGDLRTIQLLIEAQTIITKKDIDDKQIVHYAVLGGHVDLVEKLIQITKINYFIKDEHGNTLLHFATRTSNVRMVEFLISKNIDVNALNDQYESPIFNAVKNDNIEIIKVLIKEGAFIEIKNRRFETPHDIAIIHDRDKVRVYLEETQYLPSYQHYKKKHALTLAVLNRDYQEINILVMGHTRMRPNKIGKTALDYAKEYKMKSAVSILQNL